MKKLYLVHFIFMKKTNKTLISGESVLLFSVPKGLYAKQGNWRKYPGKKWQQTISVLPSRKTILYVHEV